EQPLDAPTHLLGCLVGERDRQDLMRVGLPGEDEKGDAVGQDARLARARARQDQERPLPMRHRLALGLVEALEQELDAIGLLLRRRLAGVGVAGRRLHNAYAIVFGHPLEHRSALTWDA